MDQFNYLADQTNDFAVNEKGEPVGEDGMMSAHPPSFVRNRLKDEQNRLLLESANGDTSHLEKVLVETGTIAPGSHLQKQKKASPSSLLKQHDLELLYQELESEMTAVLNTFNTPSQLSGEFDSSGVVSQNDNALGLQSGVESSQSGKDAKEGDPSDAKDAMDPSVTQVYDAEVDEMLLSEEEQKKKRELWLAANGDWLKQQEEKQKERELSGKKVTKRKKRTTVGK